MWKIQALHYNLVQILKMVRTLAKILSGSSGPKRWQNSHFQGEADAYSMEFTPLNIFESQIFLQTLIISKCFWQILATIRVLYLPTKFIPHWNAHFETKPGTFLLCKEFRVFKLFFPLVVDNDINSICWKLREKLATFIESTLNPRRQHISNLEKGAF